MNKNNNNAIGFIPAPYVETSDDSFTLDFRPSNPLADAVSDKLGLSGAIIPKGAVGAWETNLVGLKRLAATLVEDSLDKLQLVSYIMEGREQKTQSPLQAIDARKFLQACGFDDDHIDNNFIYELCVSKLVSEDVEELGKIIQALSKANSFFVAMGRIKAGEGVAIEKGTELTLEVLQEEVDASGGFGFPDWTGDTSFFGWDGEPETLHNGSLNEIATTNISGATRELPSAALFSGHDPEGLVITSIYTLADPMHDNLRELAWHKHGTKSFNISPTSRRKDLRDYMPTIDMCKVKSEHNPPYHLVQEGLSPKLRNNGHVLLNDKHFKDFSDMIGEGTSIYPSSSQGAEERGFSADQAWSLAISRMSMDLVNCLGLTHAAIANYFCGSYQVKSSMRTIDYSDCFGSDVPIHSPAALNELLNTSDPSVMDTVKKKFLGLRNNRGSHYSHPFLLSPVFCSSAIEDLINNEESMKAFIDLLKLELLPTLDKRSIAKEVRHTLDKLYLLVKRSCGNSDLFAKENKRWAVMKKDSDDLDDITDIITSGQTSVFDGAHFSYDWKKKANLTREMMQHHRDNEAAFREESKALFGIK